MEALLQDIQIGIRRLFHSRGFAAMAIGTLALGIGANTAVFTLVNAVHLRPLPFANPSQLVDVHEHNPVEVCTGCGVGTSYLNYQDWKRTSRSFSGIAAYDEQDAAVGFGSGAEKRRVARVSAEMFPVLGVAPLRGRFFTVEEEQSRGSRVALLGEALAVTAFGPDTNPVGRIVRIDGEPFEIIGVMPRQFVFPEHADLWAPLASAAHGSARNDRTVGVVARLSNDVTREQAALEMRAIGQQLATQYPVEQKGWNAFVISLHQDLAADYVDQGRLLLGAVGCVLLIACANLANLMLARASARSPELAIRAALGATRMQLARQFLIETMLVSLAGGALGLIVALWGVRLLRTVASEGLPRWIRYDMDWRVFVFTLGVSVVTGLLFGILPARVAARVGLSDVLKDGGRASTSGRRAWQARDALIVLQVGVAFVLVVAAGLLTKTMLQTGLPDTGYSIEGLVRADIGVSGPHYRNGESVVAFSDRLVSELVRARGVSSVAMSGSHFLNWPGTPQETIAIDDVPTEQSATALHRINVVSQDYFRTLGLPLVSGRMFAVSDVRGSAPVAAVSQSLAHILWKNAPAVGKRIRIGNTQWTVVGVIGDMTESPMARDATPLLYFPLAQHPERLPEGQPLTLTLRTAPGASGIASQVRAASMRVDPDVTTEGIMTVDEYLRQWRKPLQTVAIVAAVLGGFACLLAAIGIYGVIAYVVQQRTHEIGIRMALGASVSTVLQLVLRRGLLLAGVGTALGLAGAGAVTRLLGYVLFGVSPTDPVVYSLAALGFMLVAFVATYLPAQRAARVDPMEALRVE